MDAAAVQARVSVGNRWMLWVGWILSLWPAFVIISSATWKLTRNPWYVREFSRIGWPEGALTGLALLQLGCLALFLIPRTSVLGAVLLTGYLGGAIASYVRMGEPYPVLVPLSTSMIAWAGIYLREARLRALLPIRRKTVRS
jgi:DoxX-like family